MERAKPWRPQLNSICVGVVFPKTSPIVTVRTLVISKARYGQNSSTLPIALYLKTKTLEVTREFLFLSEFSLDEKLPNSMKQKLVLRPVGLSTAGQR